MINDFWNKWFGVARHFKYANYTPQLNRHISGITHAHTHIHSYSKSTGSSSVMHIYDDSHFSATLWCIGRNTRSCFLFVFFSSAIRRVVPNNLMLCCPLNRSSAQTPPKRTERCTLTRRIKAGCMQLPVADATRSSKREGYAVQASAEFAMILRLFVAAYRLRCES